MSEPYPEPLTRREIFAKKPSVGIPRGPLDELIYLALRNITAKWKKPPTEWHPAKCSSRSSSETESR